MKKVLAILAIGSFVACNSGEETTTTGDTTTVVEPVAPVGTDTGFGVTDTTTVGVDTTTVR